MLGVGEELYEFQELVATITMGCISMDGVSRPLLKLYTVNVS